MRRELDHPHQCRSTLGFKDPRKKDGELLWPIGYDEKKVEKLENKMGIYFTAGQLQQRPSPRGGGMFKREWLTKILPMMPPDCSNFKRYWDKAGTAGGEGARTAGGLVAQRSNGRYLIIDIVKGRYGSTEREAIIKAVAQMDKARFGFVEIWVEQEPGSGGKESAENTVKNLAGFSCKIERVTGAKEVRAEPFAAQCAIGNVELLLGNWNEDFISEAEQFPTGKMKDQVDCIGGAFNKLAAPTGSFASAEGIRVGQDDHETFTPDLLTADDLD
jgi:predicted phage terminase large subunit-like protein